MKKIILMTFFSVLLCCIALSASITNITKITELSLDSIYENDASITHDGLGIVYTRIINCNEAAATGMFMESSRILKTDSFDAPSSAAFTNIILSDKYECTPWMSDDKLRLYYATDKDGSRDLYFTSRSASSGVFDIPSKMANLNQDGVYEYMPRLANGELSVYFISNRTGVYRIYRATRSNIGSSFGTPAILNEISSDYNLMDISENELLLFLCSAGSYYYCSRTSIAQPFGAPIEIEEIPYAMNEGSVSGDLSTIYFTTLNYFLSAAYCDILQGDMELDPTPTPVPTPTPELPFPIPEISMAALKSQIQSFTGFEANPWGAAFDNQGGFIFFDQKAPLMTIPAMGTNQLIRMSLSGGIPVFTAIATQSQLAAINSDWGNATYWPYITGIEVSSNGAIILGSFRPDPFHQKFQLLRIDPGSPPSINAITTGGVIPATFAVDKNQTPNKIYLGAPNAIYTIDADVVDGTPSLWHTLPYTTHSPIPSNIRIDFNGDVLYAISGELNIHRVDKNTKEESYLLMNPLDTALPHYEEIHTFDVNPYNGDMIGIYLSNPAYPYTVDSYYNVFKISKDSEENYTAELSIVELQIWEDPDISPYYIPYSHFSAFGKGLRINPTGEYALCSNGTQDGHTYTSDGGINCIIQIQSGTILGISPSIWNLYQ
ncbi:hypothetical protein JW926_17350 [Candidatus Sumerlaeota bacterium]|nr:hypothetical protein [Candidatus Sumerlaeota bacterium]